MAWPGCMSNIALRWAFPIPLTGPRKAVLIAIAEHADDSGWCWPAATRISLFSGVTKRTVWDAVRDLEAAGLLVVERSDGRVSNRYRLTVNDEPNALLIAAVEVPKGRKARFEEPANDEWGALLSGISTVNGAHTPSARGALQQCTGRTNSARGALNSARGAPKPSRTLIQNPQGTLIEPSGELASQAPIDQAIKIWNRICGDFGGTVRKITPTRRAALRTRLREDLQNDLIQWTGYCETIAASSFLTGNNDRGWTADFDWALKQSNMIKVLEGRYKSRQPVPPQLPAIEDASPMMGAIARRYKPNSNGNDHDQ